MTAPNTMSSACTVVIELKNPTDEKADIWKAYDQLQTYKEQISDLFQYNEMLVISDGTEARMGSLSSNAERFLAWRTIDGQHLDPLGQFNELETLTRGILAPTLLLDYLRFFVLFEDDGQLIKKIAEADLHKVFNENINLLYYAISKKSNEDIINYLLDKNLDVNLITLDGNENVLMFSIIYDMPIDIITKIFDKTSDFSLINTEDKNLYDITLESKHSNKFDILRLIAQKIQYTNKLNKTLIIKAIEVLNNSEYILFDNLLKNIFAREDYEKSDHNRNNIFFHCVLNNKFSFIDKLKEYLRETNIELYNKLIMQTNNKRFNLLMMSVLINNPNKLLTRSVINLYTPEQLLIIKQQPYDSRTAFDIAEENNLHSDILDLLYYKS